MTTINTNFGNSQLEQTPYNLDPTELINKNNNGLKTNFKFISDLETNHTDSASFPAFGFDDDDSSDLSEIVINGPTKRPITPEDQGPDIEDLDQDSNFTET